MSSRSVQTSGSASSTDGRHEFKARFLDAYMNAYGTAPDIRHSLPKTRRRLAQKQHEVTLALDLGITLRVIEPDDGGSYFNLAFLLADLGNKDAALLAALGAVRLLDVDDPDREAARERAIAIARDRGYKNLALVIAKQ